VVKVETPAGSSTDLEQIKEFIANAPKEVFDQISKHITDMKKHIELPVQNVSCNECSKEFDMPVVMDQANFFGQGS
jgi:CRISPR/Cas system CMR-associated protein Cmr1 (group 7 of RAMP superfamily)